MQAEISAETSNVVDILSSNWVLSLWRNLRCFASKCLHFEEVSTSLHCKGT